MDTRKIKNQILDIAEDLFCYYGLKGTTVRLIAQKANINTAMVNYYFRSKENLFVVIFKRRIEQFKETEKLLDIQNTTVSAKLFDYINFLIDLIVEHTAFCKLMMLVKLSNENEEIIDIIDSFCKRNRETFKSIISKDSNHNKINSDDFMMIVSGFLISTIFKLEKTSTTSNQKKKIKIKADLQKIINSL